MPSEPKSSVHPEIMSLFADTLEALLGKELPGWEAHSAMTPPGRKEEALRRLRESAPPRQAAVLAIIRAEPEKPMRLVFIKRQEYEGTHGGQISFPGGKPEPGDATLLDAAVRETFEETGISPSYLRILGQLTPVYIPPSHFWVVPYMAITHDILRYRPDTREVEYILEVPVYSLLQEHALAVSDFPTPYGIMKNYPCFRFGNQVVWGATAMMTAEIRAVLAKLPKEVFWQKEISPKKASPRSE